MKNSEKKLTKITADDPKKAKGWFIEETEGIAVCNPRAIIGVNREREKSNKD